MPLTRRSSPGLLHSKNTAFCCRHESFDFGGFFHRVKFVHHVSVESCPSYFLRIFFRRHQLAILLSIEDQPQIFPLISGHESFSHSTVEIATCKFPALFGVCSGSRLAFKTSQIRRDQVLTFSVMIKRKRASFRRSGLVGLRSSPRRAKPRHESAGWLRRVNFLAGQVNRVAHKAALAMADGRASRTEGR